MAHHVHSDDYKEEYMYLNTADIGLDILVKTPTQQFKEFMDTQEKNSFEKNAFTFKQVWTAIKKATKDGTDKISENESEWNNLNDDIFIFYCLRWILFNKPVPIMLNSVSEAVLHRSYPDPCEVSE
jgi:hypothetical protein